MYIKRLLIVVFVSMLPMLALHHSEVYNSCRSLLLRLPGELRNEIFHHALASDPNDWPCKPSSIATVSPRVSRQAHHEVGPLIFITCAFRIRLHRLVDFQRHIGQNRTDSIQALVLDLDDSCGGMQELSLEHMADLKRVLIQGTREIHYDHLFPCEGSGECIQRLAIQLRTAL